MNDLCEACERNRAEVVEPCDDAEAPYKLCSACHHRLHALALRPLEWYNLAKRHGWWQFLLHDDFYDEHGTADQAREAVEAPDEFPVPPLADVCHKAQALLDHTITRWRINVEVAAAWKRLSRSEVRSSLSQRLATTKNRGIRSTILEVCAISLRESGAELVRLAWNDLGEKTPLASLAIASAECLPYREGFDRVSAALAQLDGRQKLQQMWCLGNFHTTEALDWIEINIAEPITESWGYLAAASKFDWPRAEKWLDGGRPLSLVALDALLAIAGPMSPFLREYAPSLAEPPSRSRLREALTEYRQRDPVPRVEKRASALLARVDRICKGT